MLFPAAIAAAGIFTYLNILHAPFIFDDRYHIVENVHIRQLWPPWEILARSSRPLIHLSLALNYALGGLNPWGYHAFNIAIHILAGLVLYGIVRRTLLSSGCRRRWGAAASSVAGLIALVWLVHPIQTESVTYTIQRGESMMGLFYLVTIYCVARLDGSQHDLAWKIAAAGSCLAGMACKGVMATAPVLAALYDRAFWSTSWRELLSRRKWFYLSLCATWLVYPVLLAQAPAEWKESAGFDYAGASPVWYTLTQPSVILHYLRLAILPFGLCLDYGWPLARGIGEVLAPAIVIGVLVAGCVWAWRRSPQQGFVGAWFFLILVPTSSFVPIADVAVEHRMYLSLAAVAVLVVGGVIAATQPRTGEEPIRIPKAAWAACGVIIAIFSALTVRRNLDYSSQIAMWRETVRVSPGNPRAQYDLARSLEAAGQVQDAIAHYQTAIRLRPTYVEALNNLGHVLAISGKAEEASPYLEKAIALQPDLAEAHCNLGYALAQRGKVQDAAPEFQRALQLKPEYAEAHNNWAIVLALQGQTEAAIHEWNEALRFDPGLADAHNNLAYALYQSGRNREALAHYEQAVNLNPEYAQAQVGLARMLSTLTPAEGGNPTRAVAVAEQGCRLMANQDPGCLETLAAAYAAANRFQDAWKTAEGALQLARSRGLTDLAREIDSRMRIYQARNAGQPAGIIQ